MWTCRRPLAAIVIALVVACGGGSECKVETIHYTKSLNAVGYGETEGVTVARFDLTQDFVSHTPYAACADGPLQDVGNVSLSITSLVPKPILLRYDVQGLSADGVPKWSHPDTLGVRLDPRVLFQETLADIATQCRPDRMLRPSQNQPTG